MVFHNVTNHSAAGAAWIDRCRPDLLISESTYATTVRDSKRCRERDFLKKVHDCIDKGGKVMIVAYVTEADCVDVVFLLIQF